MVLLGCSRQEIYEAEIESDGPDAVLKVVKIAPSHDGKPGVSLVRGTLEIDNRDGEANKINLTCLELELDGVRTDSVYVDSVAHVLPDGFQVAADSVSIDLYWTIAIPVEAADSIGNVRLIEQKGCILFE